MGSKDAPTYATLVLGFLREKLKRKFTGTIYNSF